MGQTLLIIPNSLLPYPPPVTETEGPRSSLSQFTFSCGRPEDQAAREFLSKTYITQLKERGLLGEETSVLSVSTLSFSPLNVDVRAFFQNFFSFHLHTFYKIKNRIILSTHHLKICFFPLTVSWTS